MGGNTSTKSSSGGGGGSNNNNNNNNQANQIAKQVKKDIGLTAVGGIGGPNMGYVASNAPNPQMYGGAASTAAKKAMDKAGLGTYNEDNDSFQNVVGNKIISSTGMMGTSMGSGENTIMGQIPISKQMFESQKKIQMIATGAMSALGIPLMGAAFMDYNKKKYNDYLTSFNNTVNSSTSIASSKTQAEPQQRVTDNKAVSESEEKNFVETDAENAKRMQAIARRGEALKGKRSFFSGVTKTISGDL
jgi:hypothetical protein